MNLSDYDPSDRWPSADREASRPERDADGAHEAGGTIEATDAIEAGNADEAGNASETEEAGGLDDPGEGEAADATESDSRPEHRSRARIDSPGDELDRLFFLQAAMDEGGPSKPFLRSLPERRVAERVVFDWLEFLVAKAGTERVREALEYYRRVEWISEEVEADLRDYLTDFPAESDADSALGPDDHRRSLLYVARIAAVA
ncbi:FlaD/FlaE family flagellar protein [Halegenticoccus soli]|uniref:FlaD/FlaE family flagellar protein n=1 Tax=Halegenticoccus soli TaxID=1985678 RepID=UPI000C6CDC95|nr:FlaD/FlaE family flagellar protein [Halegenticoccus soli]